MTLLTRRSVFAPFCLAVLGLAASARTQVVPAGYTSTEASLASTYPWGRGDGGARAQYAYDAANWSSSAPIVLRELRFRGDGGAVHPDGCLHNVSIRAATFTGVSLAPTFASNLGADCIEVFTGDVHVTAATGGAPNAWNIVLPVRPFLYTPTAGTALLFDITIPSGSLEGPGSLLGSNGASDAAATGVGIGWSMVSADAAATVGTPGQLLVVDVVNDAAPSPLARAERFGFGCSNRPSGLHEYFDAQHPFDLAGTAASPNSLQFVTTGTGWVTVPNAPNWSVPTGGALVLNLGDDDVSLPLVLPWAFPLPGLLCPSALCANFPTLITAIRVGSNGDVWFTDQTDTDYSPTREEFARSGPRLSPLWTDLDPTQGGTITFEIDGSLGCVVVTWAGVPQFGNAGNVNTAQAVLWPTGNVELRWQGVTTTSPILVGFTMGGRVGDIWDQDLSTSPAWTFAGVQPLDLDSSALPVIGTTIDLDVCAIPWDTPTLGWVGWSLAESKPPVNLAPPLPGCSLYLTAPTTYAFFLPSGCCQQVPLSIPNNGSYVGLDIYVQAAAINSLPWSLGVTSNALQLRIGQ